MLVIKKHRIHFTEVIRKKDLIKEGILFIFLKKTIQVIVKEICKE